MKPTEKQREQFVDNFNYLVSQNMDIFPTQEAFAKALDVSQTSVSSWMIGLKFPRSQTLEKIAALYHVSVNELVNESLQYRDFENWIEDQRINSKDDLDEFVFEIKTAIKEKDNTALMELLVDYFRNAQECETNNVIESATDYDLLFSGYSTLLNRFGKAKLIEYAEILAAVPRFRVLGNG